jgi:4-amino-4-deoxy-L-arabinose transferase-like glycosyltransferase
MYTPGAFRWLLVALVVMVGILRGSGIAGGADSYGYISQADLWIKGMPRIPQPAAREVPWPVGEWTFSPLAYRPSPSRDAIVPIVSPGFPLILAAFMLAGVHCAARVVVPITAGILVAVTYSIGRRAASDQIGAAAAWLVATSPIVLYTAMSPMSDMPAAAFWALAVFGCLRGSKTGATLGGTAAGIAILIRPNLVPVALFIALWLAARDRRLPTLGARIERTILFAIPVALGCLAVAAINEQLYGAPTSSGYGDPRTLFSPDRIGANIFTYGSWLIETQTPLAVLGLLALWVPPVSFAKGRLEMEGRGLLGVMSLTVVACYLVYLTFDAWWYLRFLLPCWPAICVGTARVLTGQSGQGFNRTAKLLLLGVGVYGLWYAYHAGAFDIGRGEQRYVTIARLVRNATPPNSVIIATQHSGSVRYYGERMTLRYEVLSERWLDGSIAWLQKRGIHTYILLDDWEHDLFKKKFADKNVLGRLDVAKVFEYWDHTSTSLYDPLEPTRGAEKPLVLTRDNVPETTNCEPPGRPPVLASSW